MGQNPGAQRLVGVIHETSGALQLAKAPPLMIKLEASDDGVPRARGMCRARASGEAMEFDLKERAAEGSHELVLSGTLTRAQVRGARSKLVAAIKANKGRPLRLDLSGLREFDIAAASLFAALLPVAKDHEVELRLGRVSEAAQRALGQFKVQQDLPMAGKGSKPFFEQVGMAAYGTWEGFVRFLVLTADTFIWSIGGEARTRRVRRGALWSEANRIGVDALPIVGLISFLVGAVVALQSAYQLSQFGADIFVANLIGVSMTREMGPLMTAIIIAGRSGAAIAAEVATMSVNEEIDALRVMGLEPHRYVVVPKFQAMTMTMPGLTVMANVLGIFGGFLVAVLYMDLGAGTFMGQLLESLVLQDILSGLIKSTAFAWIIVLVAAHNGFGAYGGAESVGLATTRSVVSSIFWVIVADALFNMLFYF